MVKFSSSRFECLPFSFGLWTDFLFFYIVNLLAKLFIKILGWLRYEIINSSKKAPNLIAYSFAYFCLIKSWHLNEIIPEHFLKKLLFRLSNLGKWINFDSFLWEQIRHDI